MRPESALENLIQRARRRALSHLVLRHLALALAATLVGLIVLLLVGSDVLNFFVLLLLFIAGLTVSLWRSRGQTRSPYAMAQTLDDRLALHDALSTAYFFRHLPQPPSTREDAEHRDIVQRQNAQAEETARGVNVQQGLPFQWPRSLSVCLALLLAAGGLMLARYGFTRNLDLRAGLVRLPFLEPDAGAQDVADAKKKAQGARTAKNEKQPGGPADPYKSGDQALDPATDAVLQTTDTPEVNNPQNSSDPSKGKGAPNSKDPANDGADQVAQNEKQGTEGGADSGKQSEAAQKDGQQDAGAKSGQAKSDSGSPSLADKMRDAVSNLMSKLKPQPKGGAGEAKQQASNGDKSSQPSEKQSGKDPGSQQNESKAEGDTTPSDDSDGGQKASADNAQKNQGAGTGKSTDRANAPGGKSGIGKEDGDKAAREAAQLAAMGKLSELFGKRAQNLSGEMTVEVSSGKQQLKTQYTQRSANHGEGGGEIGRDEVPLAYQQYIQQYFAEIHKSQPQKAKKPADKGTPEL